MKITYTTQEDGSFQKTGELPEGTTRVQIQTAEVGSKLSFKDYALDEAVELVEGTYRRKAARFSGYVLVPSTLKHRSTKDEMSSKIMAKRKKAKQEQGAEWTSTRSYVSADEKD